MQRTITFDDLDGESIATETIRFSIGDDFLELDLSEAHADEFTKAMAPFVAVARPYSPAKATTTRGQLSAPERKELMVWAKENGIEVSERGRIASAIVEQWRASKNTQVEEKPDEKSAEETAPEQEPETPAEPTEESVIPTSSRSRRRS